LGGGGASDEDGRCDGSLVGDGLGALVWRTLDESIPLEVGSTLGDEGLLELLAGCATLEDLTLEVEAGESVVGLGRLLVPAEWVEDSVQEAADDALVEVDDVLDNVVQVSENIGDDACDRVLDTASGLQRAGSSDSGGARNDVPSLSVLSEGDEAAGFGDGGRLGCDGGSATTRGDRCGLGSLCDGLDDSAGDVDNRSLDIADSHSRSHC